MNRDRTAGASAMSEGDDREAVYMSGDGLMLGVIAVGLVAAVWIGTQYGRAPTALWVGVPLVLAAGLVWTFARGSLFARLSMAVLAMVMVALQIHVGVGQNLYHFGVFVTLAILLVYRDWRVPVVGAAVIAVQHALFNELQQAGWGVVCFTQPSWGEVVAHALYVIAQTAVEVWIALLLAFEARRAREVHRLVVSHDGSIDLNMRGISVTTALARKVADALALMHETVKQVTSSAADIRATSRDIAQGNADLSQRTEKQAATLEQTAASMEELAATVRRNSESARRASELAIGASDVASRGGAAVREVVSTMKEISESSRKISEIIGIIDGIAFQTNILALNAAVEAARAGEQGRGFAVVASEVRGLAQRSAAAARETKSLIEASAGRVDAGTRLADGAGRTMDEMASAAKGVTEIIAEIAIASKQQLNSIEEVSRAVVQIEDVTQRNAALVQKSAAAADNMAGEADVLAQAVSRFQLDRLAPPAAPAPRVGFIRPLPARSSS